MIGGFLTSGFSMSRGDVRVGGIAQRSISSKSLTDLRTWASSLEIGPRSRRRRDAIAWQISRCVNRSAAILVSRSPCSRAILSAFPYCLPKGRELPAALMGRRRARMDDVAARTEADAKSIGGVASSARFMDGPSLSGRLYASTIRCQLNLRRSSADSRRDGVGTSLSTSWAYVSAAGTAHAAATKRAVARRNGLTKRTSDSHHFAPWVRRPASRCRHRSSAGR